MTFFALREFFIGVGGVNQVVSKRGCSLDVIGKLSFQCVVLLLIVLEYVSHSILYVS